MARLDIKLDDNYYKADSIIHGRKIRKFFEKLTSNVFQQSYRYWNENLKLTGESELPLCYNERNLYSIFASAINKITPVHLSEWGFNAADTRDSSRRPDFWCLTKDGNAGKRINYFIEVKKTYYCVSEGTMDNFTSNATFTIKNLVTQINDLKNIRPNWIGDGDVFLGMVVIHGYYNQNKNVGFDETILRENIKEILDKRLKAQLILSTWTLPENMDVQWEKDICSFVTIAGIVITRSKV